MESVVAYVDKLFTKNRNQQFLYSLQEKCQTAFMCSNTSFEKFVILLTFLGVKKTNIVIIIIIKQLCITFIQKDNMLTAPDFINSSESY